LLDLKEGETEDADARGQIAILEETTNQHSHDIAILEDKVTELSTDFGRFVCEVSSLRSSLTSLTVTPSQNQPPPPSPAFSQPSQPITSTPSQKQAVAPSPAPFRPSPQPPVPSFDSRIISAIPEIFAEFRKNQISLLWRGSRDGFKAQEFHGRCEGHANTLTVISDTKGNIFGGFTPVEWESRTPNSEWDGFNCLKADDSLKSFLFTLLKKLIEMQTETIDNHTLRHSHCIQQRIPIYM
jgi:hypothetical protein